MSDELAKHNEMEDAEFNFIGDYLRRNKMLIKTKNAGHVPEVGEYGETLSAKKMSVLREGKRGR